MNLLKKILISLVILTIVTPLILWSLAKYVNPDALKDILNQKLTTLTSQTSRINGNISWKLFPRPGVKIQDIHIGESNHETLVIENLLFNLQLSPLLRGKLVFSELTVDGFKINFNPTVKPFIKPDNLPSKLPPSNKSMSEQFEIESILLTRGQISFSQGQEKIVVTGLQLGATQLNLQNEIFPIKLKGSLVASSPDHKFKANINFTGTTRLASSNFSQPLAVLQNAALFGQFNIQNLQFNQFKIPKINANVITKAGEIILHPLSLSLYNGESVGDLNYHLAEKKLSFNQIATNLNATQITKDLFGQSSLKGNLDFSIHATTNLQHNWQNNLHGNGSLTIKEGVVDFIDIHQLIDEMANKLKVLIAQDKLDLKLALQTLYPAEHQKGKTKFELFTIQYRLQNSFLINDAILLQTDRLHLAGKGQVNLSDYSMDNELLLKLITADQDIDEVQQFLDGSFPFRLNGTLTNPVLLPNMQKINPILSKYLLKKTLTKPVKQLKATLKNLLHDLS